VHEGERAARREKTTLPVEGDKLTELARESVQRAEPRALGSNKMQNIGNDDARPTTQMDPAAMRALIVAAEPPIEQVAVVTIGTPTVQGMPPLMRPPAPPAVPAVEVVELGADDRKSREQLALARPRLLHSALVLLAIAAMVALLALLGWLH
jgi:hypothetical protein